MFVGMLHKGLSSVYVFVIDSSLSNNLLHTQVKESNFTHLAAYVIDVVCRSYFGVFGSI